MSDFIDEIKESLTDAQYKQGMELCQVLYKKRALENKLYQMTYLAPFTFVTEHDCDDEDCSVHYLKISFTRKTGLVLLTEATAERIREKGLFMGSDDEMKAYVDLDVLKNFPDEADDLGTPLEWFEFPVLSLELCESSCDPCT